MFSEGCKKAILGMAEDVGFLPILMQAVEDGNQRQKYRLVERILSLYGGDLGGLIFTMWGLAFKPGTDDVREASSVVIIRELISRGAVVKRSIRWQWKHYPRIDADWIG